MTTSSSPNSGRRARERAARIETTPKGNERRDPHVAARASARRGLKQLALVWDAIERRVAARASARRGLKHDKSCPLHDESNVAARASARRGLKHDRVCQVRAFVLC